ncbi:MAG TPA: hypothetical protein PK961_06585 [bacterium]|nr:hypothetical protein [bacterium]
MASSRMIAQSSGFEIRREDDGVFFLYRRTFGVAIAAWIFGGLTLFAGVWAVILPVSFYRPGESGALIGAAVLGVLFALFLTASILLVKTYLRRLRQPWEQVSNTLVADLRQGVFRRREGEVLCPLAEVKAGAGIDLFDHTGGLMRVIELSWRGGGERVFKTNGKSEVQRVLQELQAIGIAAKK